MRSVTVRDGSGSNAGERRDPRWLELLIDELLFEQIVLERLNRITRRHAPLNIQLRLRLLNSQHTHLLESSHH